MQTCFVPACAGMPVGLDTLTERHLGAWAFQGWRAIVFDACAETDAPLGCFNQHQPCGGAATRPAGLTRGRVASCCHER